MSPTEEPKRPRIDYDSLAASYGMFRSIHPEVLQSFLRSIKDIEVPRILEMGCGTGNYIIAMEAETRGRCWGHDPSEEMISTAEERSDRVVFAIRSAEDPCFAGNFFDLIFTVDVIHTIEDRMRHFEMVYRLLKPDGVYCIVTYSEEIIQSRDPLASCFPETIEADLERYPPVTALERELTENGFHITAKENAEFTYTLSDAEPFRSKMFPVLNLISDDAYSRGFERVEQTLKTGPISCTSRYLLLWAGKPGTRYP